MSEWQKRAGSVVHNLKTQASTLSTAAKQEIEKKVVEKAAEVAIKAKKMLDEKGVTEKISKASETVGDHFDMVAGIKQFELVEKRLELQNQYNDILAAKLEEALSRIEKLEAELNAMRREK